MIFKKRKTYLTISLLIFSFLNTITVFGQTFAKKNLLLSDILIQLKKEKNVTFLYEPETIKGIRIQSSFDIIDDIKITLKHILPPVGLKFKKVGKYNIVIKKAKNYHKKVIKKINQKPGQPILKQKTSAQTSQNISGILYSEDDKQTLIGATIQLKNTGIGTTTNEYGEYSLDIPKGKQILIFSYIGFEEKEVEISTQKKQNVHLKTVSTYLDEIIITAVGIESNKRILGYAADNFQIEELNRSGESNFVSALSGKSAGVWINTASGSPGASASIFIRGLRSVNGSNKPLFILDGIPVDNTTTGNGTGGVDVSNRLIDLNPNDIEKVTILKGASATALYGIRAANGAVVMTSQKGQKGNPKVRFSSSFGTNKVNKLPARQQQYTQGKYKNGLATYLGPESNTASSYGALLSELEFDGDVNYPFDKNGRLVPKGQGSGLPAKNYDAYDAFFVNGQTLDNHLSISGGTNWFNYYLSFGQFQERGVVPRSTFERYSLKGTFQIKLHDKLSIGMSSILVNSSGFRMKRGSLFSGVPLGLFRNPITFDIGNGEVGKTAANLSDAYIFDNGTQRAYRGNGRYDNPFWSVNRNPFEDKVNRLIQNVNVSYELTPFLKASYKIGFDIYTDNRKNAYDINSGTHRNGQIDLFDIHSNNINSDLLLTFGKQLSDDWHFESTFGHNFYSSEFSMEQTTGEELEKQGVFNISNAIHIQTDETFLRKKVAGVYADLHFRYKNILYFNLTGRNDWSSTLPKKNNAFFYPSLNIGFEFSELFGWTDSPILSFGKLRFSISQVGNDAGTYLTDTYYNPAVVNGDDLLPNVDFPAFGVSAFERSGILGNPNLKPETATSIELGTDLKFLKGRLNLDFTWYRSIHRDQIINTQLSAASGSLTLPTNIGAIENQGIEATLKINPIRKKHFRWDFSANFSKFTSIVTELPGNNSGIVLASFTNISSMILEGQAYGVLVGTSIKRDGKGRKIIDSDGFPKLNETQTIIGNPNPDWFLGIRNTFSWKSFTINALLDIRHGGDVWNGTKGVMSYLGISKISGDQRNVTNYVFDGITETGEVNTQSVDFANPANGMEGIYWRRYGFLGLSEDNVEDGSWIRLRELGLAYQFSPNWFRKNSTKISISLNAHNVFLITKYSGVDPETNLRGDSNILGWDYFTLPSTKGWSVQLSAIF